MATTKVGIGIDVSKETLEVASSDKKVAGTWPNTAAGLAELVGVLLQQQVHRVVLEASGGYERRGLAALHAAGLPVVLIDERSSSVEAAQRFARERADGRKRRRDAEALDAMAAAVIVERWLAAPDQATFLP